MASRTGTLGGGSRGGQFQTLDTPPKKNRGALVAIVIIVVVVILVGITLLIYFLVRRARNKTAEGTTSGGNTSGSGSTNNGGVGGNTTGPACTSNSGCSGNTPVCSTAGICVQCEGSDGCTGSATCVATACCTSAAPIIDEITTALSNNSSLTITYTYSQKAPTAPSSSNVQVEVSLQTPAGDVLATVLRPATGSVTLAESDLNLPNQRLFPQTEYRARLRIRYSCGGATGVFSSASTNNFTVGSCATTAVPVSQGMANTGGISAYSGFTGMAIRVFSFLSPVTIGALISATAGIHPNLAEISYPSLTTQNLNIDPDPLNPGAFPQWAGVDYPGAVNSTSYVRIFLLGGSCNSSLSPEYTFLRGY